jgi:hypothetical protein
MKAPKDDKGGAEDTKAAVAYGIKPENTLRKKIGAHIQSLFTPEKIKACQEIIVKAHGDLFTDSVSSLQAIEEEYALAKKDPTQSKAHVNKLGKLTFVLKGRLEAIGLTLGFEVAKSLYEYAQSTQNATGEDLVVLRKHIDILTVVLKDRLEGDGGAMGQDMLNSLSKLVKKMR